ncbi:MAG: sodium:solute symporter, partial [Planctomycetes bacterium]|nr:sodium:solute symporter [Planctomycetota bacterium]
MSFMTNLLNNIAFFGYLVGILLIGLHFRRKERSDREYFLAGRSMGWLPVGLSVMVTAFSAINFVAFPNEIFVNGLAVTVALPVFVLVAWPVTRYFIPIFYRLEITSAYEYLERRFDRRVRSLASGLFIFWRLSWMAAALFASGKIMFAVSGYPLPLIIILAGVVATIYTSFGGIKAVMWTDVCQFCILFGG